MNPFTYPSAPHIRRHGPQGYADPSSYRPWLRDEFSFRCVYCLLREQWGQVRGVFAIDHFLAVAHSVTGIGDYEISSTHVPPAMQPKATELRPTLWQR